MLDGNGVGNLADVIAGIDWVIQHGKLLNIRVMNLSLATGSKPCCVKPASPPTSSATRG